SAGYYRRLLAIGHPPDITGTLTLRAQIDAADHTPLLDAADEDPSQEDDYPTDHHLEDRRQQRRVHVALADPGDDEQFHHDHAGGEQDRGQERGNQEREGVPRRAQEGHQPADRTAHP